jgi:hypothetical protein
MTDTPPPALLEDVVVEVVVEVVSSDNRPDFSSSSPHIPSQASGTDSSKLFAKLTSYSLNIKLVLLEEKIYRIFYLQFTVDTFLKDFDTISPENIKEIIFEVCESTVSAYVWH